PEGRPANHHRKMTAAQKYDYIDEVLAVCVSERAGNSSITDKADSLLTHPAGGFVLFLIIMAAVFFLTFAVGDFLKGYFQGFLTIAETVIRKTLAELHVEKWMISLIVDGAVAGVGGVLTFLPNLVMLFLALAILEESGYMARAAYVMDDVMSQAGLSGKAFLPLLLGFGCTVPAIMAAGILEKPRDRRRVILIAPFISCSARLPIYVLFAEMFFPGKALEITYLLYLLGLGAAFFTAFAVHLFFKTEDREHALLIELPEYRFPSCRTVGVYVWERTKDYLGRAGTTIFIASAAVWLLMNLGPQGPVADVSESFAAIAGHALAPFLIPAGLGIWQVAVALISGLAAKEVVISSFCVLFGIRNISSAEGMAALLSQLGRVGFAARNAGALMVFCLLYSPCAAAAAVIRRETGSWKWTLGMAIFQTAAAWVGAVIVYQAGGLIFG
ncbi:MAG: ferrous iron transport protein B, partial [Enterocloster sp.]